MDADPAIAPESPAHPNLQSQPLENALPEAIADTAEAQFLQVTVNGDLPLLLPGDNLVEIMKLSIGQVIPMFDMAPWVVGIYNWRGDMLWIADLGHFLGFAPWYHQAEATTRHTVVVVKPPYDSDRPAQEQPPTLGLVVSAVEAMVTYPTAAMQPLLDGLEGAIAAVEPGLQPFLQGCYPGSHSQPQLVLDATAVLAAMAQP
ncbi:chemotaxis protein CheW [Nodosilinea sp. LEGE 06152]|uniref:chemotaxis protein CheW n=1 Tax=Nodosilinea sp. LEGE 06152 TaxID=2777966 RepID=UPI00187EA6F5|nr:chemotaxis protein CheW [Nodosilinea sp. LEGE 06152]MBE9159448.1 chemotaxis protein CheW [Nodosilinea sp. LEGE 06152]